MADTLSPCPHTLSLNFPYLLHSAEQQPNYLRPTVPPTGPGGKLSIEITLAYEISLQLQITNIHAISVPKGSHNTTHHFKSHPQTALFIPLYDPISYSSPQHKPFHYTLKLIPISKIFISSKSSLHLSYLFILDGTCSSCSCEYSMPIPDGHPFLLRKHFCFP